MKKRMKVVIISSVIVFFILLIILFNLISRVDFKDKIAVISVDRPIGASGSYFEDNSMDSNTLTGFIKSADKNDKVKGIIIEINSPGGSVVASKEVADAVKAVKKPKVALIREVGASGAYWVASAADVIVADPMSITGSIGVLGSYLEFSRLFEEYGITYQSITAGKYKDAGSPYKNLTYDERALLQKKLDLIYDFFVTDLAKNRNINKEKMLKLADGSVYLGIEAKENGLVDYLGNKETAIEITKKMANITEAELIEYKKSRNIIDILMSRISAGSFYYLGKGIGSELIKLSSVKFEA
ncbi:MAG: signal peptide peptidase SppA [Nanoarchaeota archaeon]